MLGVLLAIWGIVFFWMSPNEGISAQEKSFRLTSGFYSIAALFGVVLVYGLFSFVPKGRRFVVSTLVILPALYAGWITGALRTIDRQGPSGYVVDRSAVRLQDGLAALWWSREAAADLPSWTRGGIETWPTAGGDLLVATQPGMVEVVLAQDASVRECHRLVNELDEQQGVLARMKGQLHVNGALAKHSAQRESLCEQGGFIVLSSALP